MTMSDRHRRQPAAGRTTSRWRRRLTGVALLVASATAVIPAQSALANGPGSGNPQSAIRAAYLQAFTTNANHSVNLAAVEDGPALASTLTQAINNFPAATQPNQVTVNSVAPQGPQKATVNFDVVYAGPYDIGARDGTAVFVDHQWKVSRDTFCAVLALAFATCPPKVGVQPRDPAAARLAIQRAYARAFTGGQDPAYMLGAVEDGPALAATQAQAAQNYPAIAATGGASISDIVFADPRTAALNFTFTYQGGSLGFGEQYRGAVLVGNQWKVSRDTFCRLMSAAGATCPAA